MESSGYTNACDITPASAPIFGLNFIAKINFDIPAKNLSTAVSSFPRVFEMYCFICSYLRNIKTIRLAVYHCKDTQKILWPIREQF